MLELHNPTKHKSQVLLKAMGDLIGRTEWKYIHFTHKAKDTLLVICCSEVFSMTVLSLVSFRAITEAPLLRCFTLLSDLGSRESHTHTDWWLPEKIIEDTGLLEVVNLAQGSMTYKDFQQANFKIQ